MTPSEKARLGARLKAERTARGLTQRELAEHIAEIMADQLTTDLDTLTDYVKRWERGRAGVGPRYRRALADSFGIPQRQLFHSAGLEDDPVLRRQFLGAAAAAGLAVTPWSATGQPGRRIGADVLEQLRRRTVRLRRLDDVLGGIDTYRLYASELAATRTLAETSTYAEATGRELLSLLAEQAQQTGWAALDAGKMSAARAFYRDSMAAATEAGSTALMGNALAHMSYQRVTAGQHGTEEADGACRMVGRQAPPAVRALLHERAAWAHAMAGPTHTPQVESALAAARGALADSGEESPDWALWVDDIEVQIMTGRCWTILHRPERAIPALEWALARYDDTHARDKSLYLSWLADAQIDAREVDQAARTLSRAIALGADVASPRPGTRVRAVAARLRPHAATACVSDVLEQARAMCVSPV
ncbi:XRE family transcriptional regulator [Actinomadura darangshiensis]|uniref:XRE family transcriptional regulator n=1 Tax=Actinomadura darangshiensis TaxID=705336 RepID=A0A4R4ZU18_9ACTN|nr:helix-turn-helix transcriptional regulator [Actinomadura darangshiensis]TDD61960.1 XRE family transcriptional regulator [Actinomadura darangshiensis]